LNRRVGVHKPKAIGAQEGNPIATGDSAEAFLSSYPFRADFLKAGADNDSGADPLVTTGFQDVGNRRRWHGDDCKLNWIRDGLNGRVGSHSSDSVGVGIDRVNDPGVAAGEEIIKHKPADGLGLSGSSDDSNGAGF